MGMNFYWHPGGSRHCPCCKQETPSLHVGKSGWGWAFSLRVHPTEGICDLVDWQRQWEAGAILTEDGEQLTAAKMTDRILNRGDSTRHHKAEWGLDCKVGGPSYDLCNYEFS